MGTNRNLGANPASARTSNATRSSSSKVSGTPSITLTTQSRHPGPRTAQSSQSMTTGSVESGGVAAAHSGSLSCAIWLVLSVLLIGLTVTLSGGTDKFLVSTPRRPGGPLAATRRGETRAVSV